LPFVSMAAVMAEPPARDLLGSRLHQHRLSWCGLADLRATSLAGPR
jgi:hypothetical protein